MIIVKYLTGLLYILAYKSQSNKNGIMKYYVLKKEQYCIIITKRRYTLF